MPITAEEISSQFGNEKIDINTVTYRILKELSAPKKFGTFTVKDNVSLRFNSTEQNKYFLSRIKRHPEYDDGGIYTIIGVSKQKKMRFVPGQMPRSEDVECFVLCKEDTGNWVDSICYVECSKVNEDAIQEDAELMAMPAQMNLILWLMDQEFLTLPQLISHIHALNHKSISEAYTNDAAWWRQDLEARLLQSLFDPKTADISVCYDGKEIGKAHRNILKHCSLAWAAMFNANLQAQQQNRIDLDKEYSQESWQQVLEYIYSNKLNFSAEHFSDVVQIAHSHGLGGLQSLAKLYMKQNLSVENALEFLSLANFNDEYHDIRAIIEQFIVENKKSFQKEDSTVLQGRLSELGKTNLETLVKVSMLLAGFSPAAVIPLASDLRLSQASTMRVSSNNQALLQQQQNNNNNQSTSASQPASLEFNNK